MEKKKLHLRPFNHQCRSRSTNVDLTRITALLDNIDNPAIHFTSMGVCKEEQLQLQSPAFSLLKKELRLSLIIAMWGILEVAVHKT